MERGQLYDACNIYEASTQVSSLLYDACFQIFDRSEADEKSDDILEQAYDRACEVVELIRRAKCRKRRTEEVLPVACADADIEAFKAGTSIACKDGVYKIMLPLLIPHRFYEESKSFYKAKYINSLIGFALESYFRKNTVERYDKAAVLFVYTYTKSYQIRDHDNIETKRCLDRIAEYLIKSDDGVSCETHSISKLGEAAHSEIYVMSAGTAREHLYDVMQWDFGA